MDVVFTERSGKKRTGEVAICEQCGAGFNRRKPSGGRVQRYCSTECSQISARKRVVVLCHACGAEIEKTPGKLKQSRSGLYFCNRECKEKAQSLAGGCTAIQPSHYGVCLSWVSKSSSLVRDKLSCGCVGCREMRSYLLLVHHIDGDRSNNTPENLEIVCGRCHMIRHLRFDEDLGEWLFSPRHLTPRNRLHEFYDVSDDLVEFHSPVAQW